jgi:cardiolipin synthase
MPRTDMRRASLLESIPGNRVTLLHDGAQCLPAMLQAIGAASREILLEMYWFGSDATGRRFAAALIERARAGVRVCVSYDAIGSLEADRDMFLEMAAAGCHIFEYHPWRFWHPRFRWGALNRRDHRKILVVDGRLALTGGVNLGDPWASLADGGLDFRDDMIQVEGPGAAPLREVFFGTFRGAVRTVARNERFPIDVCGSVPVRYALNDDRRNRRSIERAYLQQIRGARSRVLITNSYFIPDRQVRRALADAAERGVEVSVLLPVDSDVPAVGYATRRLYGWMLERGIRIHEWGQSILHSKTAVIDGSWCTVGSHNLDYRSWALNLELNVIVEDPTVAGQLEQRMTRDMAESVPVDPHTWKFRPLGVRVAEQFFYRLRRLM